MVASNASRARFLAFATLALASCTARDPSVQPAANDATVTRSSVTGPTTALTGSGTAAAPVPNLATAKPLPQSAVPAASVSPEPSPATIASRIGVQIFEADVDTPALSHLQDAGVRWARTRVLSKLVEPRKADPPVYDWTVTDRFFNAVADAGMQNITSVYANPEWVTDRECLPVPANLMDRWSARWGALVERYDGDQRVPLVD